MPTVARPARLLPALAAALLGVAVLPGCSGGSDDTAEPQPTGTAPAIRTAEPISCMPEGTATAATGPEDDPTLVAWTGSGTKGVVLAPQAGDGPCDWADELTRLASEGYLVATFGWAEDGASSVVSTADLLRSVGAEQIALIGASKGGAYVAAVADQVDPVTVIALSPPAEFEGANARSDGNTYDGPLLVVASTDDQSVHADVSKQVARADDPNTFVELDGAAHGVALFQGPHKGHVEALIDSALQSGFAG